MVFSIGIISAKSSLAHIQSSLSSRKSATYQFHYFPYSSVDEVPQIYKEHEHECDGFVFSGSLPYYQLLRHYSKLRVPCTYIEVTHRDYYRTLLQVTYQNPHLDIRRIWMDRPVQPGAGRRHDSAQLCQFHRDSHLQLHPAPLDPERQPLSADGLPAAKLCHCFQPWVGCWSECSTGSAKRQPRHQ